MLICFLLFLGVKRENHLFLSRFVNSVIIIDEVQAYKNSIWKEIIIFLNQYAKYFNIKIIIMSATLPKLNRLIDEENEKSVDLITKKDNYFRNPLFRNRVKIDESLLEKEKLTLEELERFIIELSKLKKKIIIEFIKKKTAREFYKLLKEEIKDTEIVEISGDDNHYTRNLILEKIQNKTNIVVVCTQVIEAGVDIDMDIGLKDISLLELEEQFLGRINRSCKKQGCVTYFFNYDKASDIYREDLRTQYDIREKRYFNLLQEKSFDLYYQQILEKINQRSEERNRNNIEGMLESIRHLHFSVINQKMKLIEKNNVQIFLAHNMKINNEIIDGKKVWEGYKEICDNQELEYAEKQIKLSTIMGVMELFLYSIEIYDKESQKLYFTEEMGNILYIEEGEEFLDEGKFDREKYFKKCGEIFW